MVSQAMRSRGWERKCCLNEGMTVNEIFQVGKIAFIDVSSIQKRSCKIKINCKA